MNMSNTEEGGNYAIINTHDGMVTANATAELVVSLFCTIALVQDIVIQIPSEAEIDETISSNGFYRPPFTEWLTVVKMEDWIREVRQAEAAIRLSHGVRH